MPQKSSGSVKIFYPEFNKENLTLRIKEKLPLLSKKLPLHLVILFGSYARGNSTVASDVDLLVVYKGPGREDAYSLVKKTLAVPRLEPHLYTLDEYEQTKEMVDKMTEGGLILFP